MSGMANDQSKPIQLYSIEFWRTIARHEFELLELAKKKTENQNNEKAPTYYSKAALEFIMPVLLRQLEGKVFTVRGFDENIL